MFGQTNIVNLLCLFLLVLSNFICFGLKAQKIAIDSDFQDTVGMWADLSLIEQKIGPLADSIRRGIIAVEVQYYGFDGSGNVDTSALRQGILVIHRSVEADIRQLFQEFRRVKFPIAKVIPVNKYGLNRDTTGWDDTKSMEDNNTSAFNYRFITHSTDLSPHGFGTAIDFNPLFNPYESYHHDGKQVEPDDAFYDLHRPGTISDSVLVGLFDKRGWIWGGRWNNPVDFQHFDKRSDRGRKHYLMKESGLKDYFRYGDGDGSIALYAEPYYKKQNQPELLIYKEERDTFLHYMRRMQAEECYQLFKAKGRKTWAEFRVAGSPYFIDFVKDSLQQIEILENLKSKQKFKVNKKTEKPLAGLWIHLYAVQRVDDKKLDSLNWICAEALSTLLEKAGAQVITPALENKEGTFHHENPLSSLKLSVGLAIAIDFGNKDLYNTNTQSDDFQVIYVPAAWKEGTMHAAIDRISFLRALLSDDLPKSISLAQKIQNQLQSDLGLAPVSPQLPGPNLLETDCIKTDIDGIYGRYIPVFNDLQAPAVYIAPYSIYHPKTKALLYDKKKGAALAKKTAKSIADGLLEWLEGS